METIQTLHFGQALLPQGWARDVRIRLVDGIISAITTDSPAATGDERHDAVIPGLPNLHSHAFQRGVAGLAELAAPGGDSFWTWRETMYRFVGRLTPGDLAAIAAFAYVEMLESGFTRVGEFHYLHHDRDGRKFSDPSEMSRAIIAAASASGIGLTLLPVFYAHGGFGGIEPKETQRRFLHDPGSFAELLGATRKAATALPDAIVGIALHSLRAVTPAEIALLLPLADGAPIHIHAAEQRREVEECIAWSGARPVEWLLDHAPVDANWCLIHATHMTGAETASLARSKAVAGLCPITEANLGDGIFPAEAFIAQGGAFGIGSDSNILIDAAEELRLLEYSQRLAARARNIVRYPGTRSTGEALYRHALAGGSQALGAIDAGIAPGNSADFVSLNMSHPSLYARSGGQLLDGLLFAARRSAIDCVWRRGDKLVSAGRHRARAHIIDAYREVLKRMLL